MNAKLLVPAVLLALATSALAQASSPKPGATTSTSTQTEWNTNPAYWERMLTENRDTQGLRIGKSDWQIKGVIPEGLRRKKSTGDRSTAQRLAELPIVRLVVPQPTEAPPGGGKYFLWGESNRPWVTVSAAATTPSTLGNLATHEARTSLISIGR